MRLRESIELVKLILLMGVLTALGRHFPDWIALILLGLVIVLSAYSASTIGKRQKQ
jgi:hypothetical protein